MTARHVLTIFRKELRDTLRDRRTLYSMIVVPTLVMPALILFVGFIAARAVKQVRSEVPTVMVLGAEHSPRIHGMLAADDGVEVVPPADDWRDRIASKRVRAVVEIPAGFERGLAAGEPMELRLYHYEGELKSGLALRHLGKRVAALKRQLVAERLSGHGIAAELTEPFTVVARNVAPPEKVGGNAIGAFLPYLFILLCFTGAMYPAIDLTAGEKERGTMETILCSPIARIDLVLGKFLLVLTASLATVFCSLLSMGATLAAAAFGLAGRLDRVGPLPSLDPAGVLGVVAMVVPFAAFFSAVLLALSLVARSFKEAQSYVSPLLIVVILPAVVGTLPGVELDAKLALVPVLNLSLVSREMVSGVFQWNHIALVFASSWAYAAAALAWCVRMFNREDVIFRV